MKVKTRITLSIITLFVLLIGTHAFTPAAHAAPLHQAVSRITLAGSDDPDNDGLTNAQEKSCGTDPKKADSDNNGIKDGADDRDHDGLSNKAEFQSKTQCRSKDTDKDGLSDGEEIRRGTDPKSADSDHDGVKDGKEVHDGTDPRKSDKKNDDTSHSEDH